MSTPVVALTIAGSDSGGGAGIQADIKTFAALGVFGTSAVTAVTAQHTAGVLRVAVMDPDMVVAQVRAVLSDLAPRAVKTGMLADADVVAAVAAMAADGELPNLVVDPVLVSTSGHPLMAPGGIAAYRELLLPHATVATPNLHEAALLAGCDAGDIASVEAMTEIALALRELGPSTVIVKGGHAGSASSADVVAGPGGVVVLEALRIETRNDHGTGCSLSAAICAHLAGGAPVGVAVERAKAYVHGALASAARWSLGSGHGPIDHFGWSATDPERTPTAP